MPRQKREHAQTSCRFGRREFLDLRFVVLIITWAPCLTTLAADEDSRLRKRVAELEAENRALRKIIGDIRGALKSVPETTILDGAAKKLRIVVLPGDWGGSQLEDLRRVCVSAAGTIWSQIPDDGLAPIVVQRSRSGPISLFRRGEGREYIVKLDTGSNAWAQCAFQFSHEFCHVVCNYRNVSNSQLWFEESLCECASLFALRRMAVEWKTKPPYSNWKSYSAALAKYAAGRIGKYDDRKESLSDFYRANRTKLERNGTNRELNGFVAIKLLPLFEKTPSSWQALRYINLGPQEENAAFDKYLRGWQARVPDQHKPFVADVAERMGVSIPSK